MQRQFPSWKRDRRQRRGRLTIAESHGNLAIARDADQRTRRRDHHGRPWHLVVPHALRDSHCVADTYADRNGHGDGWTKPGPDGPIDGRPGHR